VSVDRGSIAGIVVDLIGDFVELVVVMVVAVVVIGVVKVVSKIDSLSVVDNTLINSSCSGIVNEDGSVARRSGGGGCVIVDGVVIDST